MPPRQATARPQGARSGRRQQILAAAAPLFATRGFHGVSVDDLGAATGISGPALYRHFRAKEEILTELLVGVSERLLAGGARRAAEAADPGHALAALVAFHVDFALDEPDVITVQERDLASLPPEARRSVRELQHRYVSVWAGVIGDLTGWEREPAVAAAHAAFGLMNSTPHSARLPRQEMAALLRAMTLAAILAGTSPVPRRVR
jgi:AcrR family transcriptional regulator